MLIDAREMSPSHNFCLIINTLMAYFFSIRISLDVTRDDKVIDYYKKVAVLSD